MPVARDDGAIVEDLPAIVWRAWQCEACGRVLMELDARRPAAIRKKCEKCGHRNLWVTARISTHSW